MTNTPSPTLSDIQTDADGHKVTRPSPFPGPFISPDIAFVAASDAMCLLAVQPEGGFVAQSINPAFTELTGLAPNDVIGKSVEAILSGADSAEAIDRFVGVVERREAIRFEASWTVGRPTTVDLLLTPVLDDSGNCRFILCAARNLAERRAAESQLDALRSQLHQAQRMETLAILAGGIAHEFQNLIAVIDGHIKMARRDGRRNPKVLEDLAVSSQACRLASDIAEQILAFSARQPTERRVFALSPLVEAAVRLLRAALPPRLTVEFHAAEELPPVLANATQIQQVVLNLGINAGHAMEGRSGAIRVDVDSVRLIDMAQRPRSTLNLGLFARISVTDSGVGMDPETLAHIFEALFTTRAPGRGTGLGLYIAHNVMQAHGGALLARSQPGKGSTFTAWLPAAPSHATEIVGDKVPPQKPPYRARSIGARILYLDDERWLIPLVERLLTDRRYHVRGFVDPQAALDALHTRPDDFDLVVTDHKMPGFSGFDIIRAVKAVRPDLPVILASANLTEEFANQAANAGADALLFKPAVAEELIPAIDRLLARRTASARDQ
jgi:PAS domain S-box-containing protein